MATLSQKDFFGGTIPDKISLVGNETSIISDENKNGNSYFKRVLNDFSKAGENITQGIQKSASEIQQGVQTGGLEGAAQVAAGAGKAALRTVGNVAGAAFAPVTEAPVIKQGLEAVGEGIAKIPGAEDFMMKATEIATKYPESAQDIQNLIDIAGLGLGKAVQKPIQEVASKVGTEIIDTAGKLKTETFNIGKKALPKSPEIMNRVARLTPTQARKFKELAGETHGEYLTRTGNFGNPQQIVENEAQKFAQSVKSVDDTLATLEGKYNTGVIDDVLKGLNERVILTSTDNVPSPISSKVNELIAKNKAGGLTMSEINDMKRLYEREVKLGYNKALNPDKVQTATNVDNALRDWQVNKAEELGFSNLRELNKQTQVSKNIINSLGDQTIGQTGLNNINLTDWIMLSGGDPTAVGGFLTKKFFSSKDIQSKIAKMLSDVKPEGIKKPIVTPSKQQKLQK